MEVYEQDELNGTGAIRSLLADPEWEVASGTVLIIPVAIPLGFERHFRYLPDRRDLNRCFLGSESGSMATRLATLIFDEVVEPSEIGKSQTGTP